MPLLLSVSRRLAVVVASRLVVACGGGYDTPAAPSGITRIDITSATPVFERKTFGNVGVYEKLRRKAYGELDPSDPRNAVITDVRKNWPIDP